MQPPFHRFSSNEELSQELAVRVAADLAQALERRGEATLAVSGGSTPALFFKALSLAPLDWSRVAITQVDERWVDEAHSDSNARLIREQLLQNNAAVATFISMKTDAKSPFTAEADAREKLQLFDGEIDVIVLGMGEDGHTASFFPDASTLGRALDPAGTRLCVAVSPPQAPHMRMTLALPAILRACHCYLHIAGAKKLQVLEQAFAPGDVQQLPVRSVLHSPGRELEIYYAEQN